MVHVSTTIAASLVHWRKGLLERKMLSMKAVEVCNIFGDKPDRFIGVIVILVSDNWDMESTGQKCNGTYVHTRTN